MYLIYIYIYILKPKIFLFFSGALSMCNQTKHGNTVNSAT